MRSKKSKLLKKQAKKAEPKTAKKKAKKKTKKEKKTVEKKTHKHLSKLDKLIAQCGEALKKKNYTKARANFRQANLLAHKTGAKKQQEQLKRLHKKLEKIHAPPKPDHAKNIKKLSSDLTKGMRLLKKGKLVQAEAMYKQVYGQYYSIGFPAERYYQRIINLYKEIMNRRYREKHKKAHRKH